MLKGSVILGTIDENDFWGFFFKSFLGLVALMGGQLWVCLLICGWGDEFGN